jgi:hypothetical protein
MAGEKLRDQLAAEKSTAGGDDGKSGTGARSKPTKGADNKVSSYLLLLLLCRIGLTTTHQFCKLRCFSVISTIYHHHTQKSGSMALSPEISKGVSAGAAAASRGNAHLREVFHELLPLYLRTADPDAGSNSSNNSSSSSSSNNSNSSGSSSSNINSSSSGSTLDGFLLYLFAVVVKQLDRLDGHPLLSVEEAQAVLQRLHGRQAQVPPGGGSYSAKKPLDCRLLFMQSLRLYPWNW